MIVGFLVVIFPREIICVVCDLSFFMFMWLAIVFLIPQNIFRSDSVFNFSTLLDRVNPRYTCLLYNFYSMVQYLTFCLPSSSPCSLRILGLIEPLLIQKIPINDSAFLLRLPDDLIHDMYNFLIVQLIVIFPLTPVSTGPSLEMTCNNYL